MVLVTPQENHLVGLAIAELERLQGQGIESENGSGKNGKPKSSFEMGWRSGRIMISMLCFSKTRK